MRRRKKVSIKDLSKELDLSITTISFIINKKAENKISKEVIDRVEAYIEKVGYKPNSSAQSLRTGKSKTIVFMAEDISDPFFSAIAKQMEELAFNEGYKIIYCSTENDKERALELLQLFRDRQVDAFIITPPEHFEAELKAFAQEEKAVVMVFDRCYKSFDHHYVVLENEKAAAEATAAFIKAERRNIGFIGIDSELSPLQERLSGYKTIVAEQGLEQKVLLLDFNDIRSPAGQQKIATFLEEHPELDALLFSTNSLAITGLRVLKEKQIEIPYEIALISFDERDFFELYTPSISVLAQPVDELATELIRSTLMLLKSKNPAGLVQKRLEGNLVLRGSIPDNF